MQNRGIAILAVALLICLASVANSALMPYSQDFEGLIQADPDALANDGWLVFGNVFGLDWSYWYGYGPFGAPNTGAAFCAIAVGEGGPDQGLQQLVVFSDYENTDQPDAYIESNVFQEQTIEAANVGEIWIFDFNAKLGNLEGSSTAAAFIKTLDPNDNYNTTNLITADMTATPPTWSGHMLYIEIDASLAGQILQFGFVNIATNYEGSGIFYDNLRFYLYDVTDVPEGPVAIGAELHQNYPNPFNPQTRIEFAIEQTGNVDISVIDITGRRIATLHRGVLAAGEHAVTWNGTTDRGTPVATGQYWYVLSTPSGQVSRSMTLLK